MRSGMMDQVMSSFGLIGGSAVILAFIGAILALCGFCWMYAINEWLVYLGKEPVVMLWHGVLLAIVPGVGQAAIPVAAVTWIVMLFLL